MSDLLQAEAEQTEARAHQSEARAMIRELGTLFHPYDLEHGQVQPVAQVAARFADLWDAHRDELVPLVQAETGATMRVAKTIQVPQVSARFRRYAKPESNLVPLMRRSPPRGDPVAEIGRP